MREFDKVYCSKNICKKKKMRKNDDIVKPKAYLLFLEYTYEHIV